MLLHWMIWSAARAAAPTKGTITTTRATPIISLRNAPLLSRPWGAIEDDLSPVVSPTCRTLMRPLPPRNPLEAVFGARMDPIHRSAWKKHPPKYVLQQRRFSNEASPLALLLCTWRAIEGRCP